MKPLTLILMQKVAIANSQLARTSLSTGLSGDIARPSRLRNLLPSHVGHKTARQDGIHNDRHWDPDGACDDTSSSCKQIQNT